MSENKHSRHNSTLFKVCVALQFVQPLCGRSPADILFYIVHVEVETVSASRVSVEIKYSVSNCGESGTSLTGKKTFISFIKPSPSDQSGSGPRHGAMEDEVLKEWCAVLSWYTGGRLIHAPGLKCTNESTQLTVHCPDTDTAFT